MWASMLEHTFPWGGTRSEDASPSSSELKEHMSGAVPPCPLGPVGPRPLPMHERSRLDSADGWTPAAGDMAGVGWGWVHVWEGGCVQSWVIRGNAFRASGERTSGELDSPNPLLLGVAPGGFMSPRWTWACGDVTGRGVREAPLHKRMCLQMLLMCSNCCPFAWLLQIVYRGATQFSSTLLFQTFPAASGPSQACGLRHSCSVFGGSDMFQQAGWAFFLTCPTSCGEHICCSVSAIDTFTRAPSLLQICTLWQILFLEVWWVCVSTQITSQWRFFCKNDINLYLYCICDPTVLIFFKFKKKKTYFLYHDRQSIQPSRTFVWVSSAVKPFWVLYMI